MEHVKIHEQVRLVDGYLRSIAYDLQRGEFFFIPKSLSVFLKENDKQHLSVFKQNQEFNDYLEFLLEKEIIFFEDKLVINNFSSINLTWDSPFQITNIVIDSDLSNINLLKRQIDIIEKINIKHVHFNLLNFKNLSLLDDMLILFESTCVHSIDILFHEIDENLIKEVINKSKDCLRVSKILIPNKYNEIIELEKAARLRLIYFESENVPEKMIYNFMINTFSFTEALNHNVYFNRKMFIDKNGILKNSMECKENFGNVLDLSYQELHKVLSSKEFTKYFFIPKDKCDVCKDCEFKYMCNDNRIPVERNLNEWLYETECLYNPYIAKWKHEENYFQLLECGVVSNNVGFKIETEILDKLNVTIWDN